MKTNKEKFITRTLHFATANLTIYDKETKEIREDRRSALYHKGDNAEDCFKWFLAKSERLVDVEIISEFNALYRISESAFIAGGEFVRIAADGEDEKE